MGHALSAIVGALFAEAQRVLKGLVVFGLTRRPIILLALLVFIATGIAAFFRLNIEAYPNPAPVILEITAQAAGQSAEEMERYYTIPMEVVFRRRPASISFVPRRFTGSRLSASPSITALIITSRSRRRRSVFSKTSACRTMFRRRSRRRAWWARYFAIRWWARRTSGSPIFAPSRTGCF